MSTPETEQTTANAPTEGTLATAFAVAREAKEKKGATATASKKAPNFSLPSRTFRNQLEERRKKRDALILRGQNLFEQVLNPLPEEICLLVLQREGLLAEMAREIDTKGPTARLAFEGELKQYEKFLEGYLEATFDPNLQPHERAAVRERASVAFVLAKAVMLGKKHPFPGDIIRLLEGSRDKNAPEDKFSAVALGVVNLLPPNEEAAPHRRQKARIASRKTISLNRAKAYTFDMIAADKMAVAAAKKVFENPDIKGFVETVQNLWVEAVQCADAKHAAAEREMRKGISQGATFHDLMDGKAVTVLLRDPGEEIGDRVYLSAEIKVVSDGASIRILDAEGRGANGIRGFVNRKVAIPQKYLGDSFLRGGQRPDLQGVEFALWATLKRAILYEAKIASLKAEGLAKFEEEKKEAATKARAYAKKTGLRLVSAPDFHSGKDGVAALGLEGPWFDKKRGIKVWNPVIVVARRSDDKGGKITLVATVGDARRIFEDSSVNVGGEYYERDPAREQPYGGCAWPLSSLLSLHASRLAKKMGEKEAATTVNPPASEEAAVAPANSSESEVTTNPLACSRCGFVAKNKGGLTAHMKKHDK